jgi:hypothetical protein
LNPIEVVKQRLGRKIEYDMNVGAQPTRVSVLAIRALLIPRRSRDLTTYIF